MARGESMEEYSNVFEKIVLNKPIVYDNTPRALLIDSDSLLYEMLYKIDEPYIDDFGNLIIRTEEEQFEEGKFRVANKIQEITNNIEEWYNIQGKPFMFVGGKNNFRYNIYPEYKANRKNIEKPKWFYEIKEYYVNEFGWIKADGYEADDAIYTAYLNANKQVIAAYIDKDLKGWLHCPYYNYRSYKNIIGEFGNIEKKEGIYLFAIQCLMGDSGDNVKGVPKIGIKKVQKLIHEGMTSREYIKAIYEAYLNYYKDPIEAKRQAKLNYTLLKLHNINK